MNEIPSAPQSSYNILTFWKSMKIGSSNTKMSRLRVNFRFVSNQFSLMVSRSVYTRVRILWKLRCVSCKLYSDLHRIRRVRRKVTFTSSTISHSDEFLWPQPTRKLPSKKFWSLTSIIIARIIHLILLNVIRNTFEAILPFNWHCIFSHPIFLLFNESILGNASRPTQPEEEKKGRKKKPVRVPAAFWCLENRNIPVV